MPEVGNLQGQHQRLSADWLEAENCRVAVLHRLLAGLENKCVSDIPDHFFQEYEAALTRAASASREYTKWLAQQGIRAR